LAAEDLKAEVRIQLKEAVTNPKRDRGMLQAALKRGRSAELGHKDIWFEKAEKMLKDEETKANARAILAKALRERSIDDIRSSIKTCEMACLPASELEEARRKLAEEERVAEAAAAWQRVENARKILKTVDEKDSNALRDAIYGGESAGLPDSELDYARRALARMEEEARLAEANRQAEEARNAEEARLAEANRQAEEVRNAEVHRLLDLQPLADTEEAAKWQVLRALKMLAPLELQKRRYGYKVVSRQYHPDKYSGDAAERATVAFQYLQKGKAALYLNGKEGET